MSDPLYWDATYAIALALKRKFTDIKIEDVSLQMIYEWTLELEDFQDDPALGHDGILSEIYKEWFEEMIHDDK